MTKQDVLRSLPLVAARGDRYELRAWVLTGKDLGIPVTEMASVAGTSRHVLDRLLKPKDS